MQFWNPFSGWSVCLCPMLSGPRKDLLSPFSCRPFFLPSNCMFLADRAARFCNSFFFSVRRWLRKISLLPRHSWSQGALSGWKIPVWNFGNGTVYSGCIDQAQDTARLVIVLVSRMQKSVTGDNNFVKWKGTFWSDRKKWADRSKWTTFKAGPEYSGPTKPKWSVSFDF